MKHFRLYLDTRAASSAIPDKVPPIVKTVLALVGWTPCLWAFNATDDDLKATTVKSLAGFLPFFTVQETA